MSRLQKQSIEYKIVDGRHMRIPTCDTEGHMHPTHAAQGSAASAHHPLLRHRDGHHARVTFEELFFDLVYVFAVTQLSHQLLHHLTVAGVIEVLILWFAVWLGWQYTTWVTNWFDPETPHIRGLIFANMLLGLVMASSIPQAFGERGMVFALSYVAIQVGRTAFIALQLPSGHALAANYRRMLVWLMVSAVFWIAGALAEHETRALLWFIAVVCEYGAPMVGFAVPGMGRSNTREWTIEGATWRNAASCSSSLRWAKPCWPPVPACPT
jgi:low temperature requirement protein LtrA